jgi:peptidoglycan/LPS O-acetylase OafA/YrhL
MSKPFLEKFRRITSSGFYLPQVDGLRFLAIFMVVCIAHIPNFINRKLFEGNFLNSYWSQFSLEGVFGILFFFIISGFVLGHLFAKKYIHNNEKADLKSYYLRRLTRMEPPYLLALIIFFIALVFIVKKYEFAELFPHFIASFFYVHNEVYYEHSYVLPVAWTLEIEIQFYLLAPLLGLLYRLKKREIRWVIFLVLILANAYYWYNVLPGMHVFKFIHYFLCGMLMADLYVERIKFPGPVWLGFIIGIISLVLLSFVFGFYDATGYIIKCILMVFLFYTALTNEKMIKVLSYPPLAIIGGMCYSIYLIHEQVISATGRLLKFINIENPGIYFILSYLLLGGIVLMVSAVYFKLVEQPCMKKDWWKKFFSVRKN